MVVGGDGTLREAAEGLWRRGSAPETPLGFVPLGNANVIARELGIPLKPTEAIEVLLAGEPRAFDAMQAGGHFILAMIGVGFDGIVTAWMDRARDRGITGAWYGVHGDSLYGTCGVGALFARTPSVSLRIDQGEEALSYRHLWISNTRTYAKGWSMTPSADPADGQLDLAGKPGRMTLRTFWNASRCRPVRGTSYSQGARFQLMSAQPFRWQADGDPMEETTELEVEVLPAALRIIAPRRAANSS